jgi:alpha-beta hydrolase superfamily lysophospholipase
MAAYRTSELQSGRGRIIVHQWRNTSPPRHLILIAHGYGEHAARYDHVAQRLVAHGAAVYAPDHRGHGRSDGERALVDDVEGIVDDLHAVAERARAQHPNSPMMLIGHSMGGLIATRFAQRYGDELRALVLSGPAIGSNPGIASLLALDPIPEIPIDPDVLSRDASVGQTYAADPLVFHGPFARATLHNLVAAVERVAAAPTFGKLPVLWIHGDDDTLVPLAPTREAIQRLRGDRLVERIYPGGRHEMFNEINKEAVLDDVVAFIDRVVR